MIIKLEDTPLPVEAENVLEAYAMWLFIHE